MRRAWLLAPFFFAGCYTLGPPPSGYETDEYACSDGRDNDQDSRIDCMDTDCLMRGHCGEQIPIIPRTGPENTFDACQDGIDNDEDGQFDCGDRQCQSIMELCCVTEVDDASCSDRIDNDGNGFADCGDFSCRNNVYVTVCASETRCNDAFDDDGDRRTDCNDEDCACDPVCNADCAGPEDTAARCVDGIDNDGNGFVDCGDFSCSMHPDPAVSGLCGDESTLEQCTNDVDDDNDGFMNCADFSCQDVARGATPEAAAFCATALENTLERCMDGVDNDSNGFTDCADFSCGRSIDAAILAYCAEFTEASLANCTDNIDNDHNGFVDCGDFGCEFVIAGWGVNLCVTNEDCGDGSICQDNTCIFSCAAGEACPAGTQCEPLNDICVQTCAVNAECDLGESCYRGRCLALRSPCIESAWIDAETTVKSHAAATPSDDATLAEQIAMSVGQCTDGRDGDGDGFVDCEDWECNYNPRVVDAATSEKICQSAGGRTCVLGARAGQTCDTDADCGSVSGACALTGPAGRTLVCP